MSITTNEQFLPMSMNSDDQRVPNRIYDEAAHARGSEVQLGALLQVVQPMVPDDVKTLIDRALRSLKL